ncbi:MAG: pantoate--beta-alanine ligase, partial [Flavobacteriales bacterium]
APLLYEVLTESKYMLRYKQASEVRQWVKEQFEGNRYFTLEYFEIADACNLMPLDVVKGEGQVIGLIAARLGNVRLIDNIRF